MTGNTSGRGNGNQVRGGLTGKSGATGPPLTPASPREGEKREGTKALLRHELGFAKGAPCAQRWGRFDIAHAVLHEICELW